MAVSQEKIEQVAAEQSQAILDARARRLAMVNGGEAATHDDIEVVTLGLGEERLAIETRFVHELLQVAEVTAVPTTPDHLLGVTNVRGTITALMDISSFLGITIEREVQPRTFLLLGLGEPEFAIVVDEIGQVTRISSDEIVESPGNVSSSARELLKGVTDEPMLVLDGDAVLGKSELWIEEIEA